MKTSKKLLSALLALVMLLSCGVAAFAEGTGNWTPIPTSPSGLSAGDYYLDFTFDYYDWSPNVRDDRLAMWNAGEWYVDHDAHAVKGSFTVPAAMSDTGEAFTQVIDPSTDLYVFAVVKVGQWQPIPTSPAGLENGEFYLDFTYDWNAWSPASRQARLDMWNAGEWYVDHTNRMIKGTFTVPADQSESGVSFVRVVKPYTSESTDLYVKALMIVGNWVKIPTSPDGLQKGDVWFNFSKLFTSNPLTADEQAQLARFNAADWYADFDALMVKCVSSDPDLNGEYTNQHAWINCTEEVGVSWVPVSKTLAGLQVGDYYIDVNVFYQTAEAGYFTYFSAQYNAQYSDPMPAATAAQLHAKSAEITDMQFKSNVFAYNPGGNQYHYQLNGMPFPYARCMVSSGIGDQTMIVVDALAASIRQLDAATAAASPWVKVATSLENAEEGGYYIDFDDPAVMAAMNVSNPTPEDVAMVKGGEWYADFGRCVVCGKITQVINGESYTDWTPESSELFTYVKVKPVTPTEDPGEQENPQPQRPSFWRSIVSFFLRLVDFFKKLFK